MNLLKYFFLLNLIFTISFAQSYHSITVDGTINTSSGELWNDSYERFSTSSGATVYGYITWDSSNIYVAYPQIDFDGSNQAIYVVLDTDPKTTPKSGNGIDDLGFDSYMRGSRVTAPFNADYIFMVKEVSSALEKNVYSYSSAQWNLNGANGTTDLRSALNVNYGNASGSNKDIELSISRSALGINLSGDAVRVIVYCKNLDDNSGWGYLHRAIPDNGTTDGTNDKTFYHWYGFELKNGINPNDGNNYDKNAFLNWDITFAANISSLGLSDLNNIAGVSVNATDGYDAGLDLPKPPPAPSNYVYLNFPHSGWDLGPYFYKDIKAYKNLDTTVMTWEFTVSTDKASTNVSVAASDFADIPSNYYISLKDLTGSTSQNLRQNATYTYNSGALAADRNFQLIIGKYAPNLFTVSSVNFGQTKIESDSTISITLYNTGLDTLKISNITISGSCFSLNALATPFNILSGENVIIYAKFSPLDLTSYTGQIQISSNDPDSPLFNIALSGTGIKPTLTKTFPKGWNLIGIPVKPNNPKADSIFKPYASTYLLYKYKKDGGYSISDSVFLGEGYWLGVYDTIGISLTGLPQTSDTIFALRPGWNILSNVFMRNFLKSKIDVNKGLETIGFDSAVTRGWIQSALYKFSRISNSYQTADTLKQFEGYWLSTLTDNLTLKFRRSQVLNTFNKIYTDESKPPYDLLINFVAQNSVSKDETTILGLAKNATDGFDSQIDNAKPPIAPIDGALELYFNHNDWSPLFSKFSTDIKPLSDASQIKWKLELNSKKKEKTRLIWNINNINNISSTNILLVDNYNGNMIDMSNSADYSFEHLGGIRSFSVIINQPTTVNPIEANYTFSLSQNYPNPFNPTTMIEYEINNKDFVQLKIYDVLGNVIETLISKEQAPGKYSTTWNATKYSSGIYYYELTAGNYRAIKKMILVK